MCGRKTLTKGKLEIIERLSISEWDDTIPFQLSYNVAPTQFHPVLIYEQGRIVKMMQWGLIPPWYKDHEKIPIMINARIETLTEKPSFAHLVNNNRCLIISDGYYEWQRVNNRKQPYFIHRSDGDLLLMAGLWSRYNFKTSGTTEEKSLLTYTVITTDAFPELSKIHPRMPAFISIKNIDIWLDRTRSFNQVKDLIQKGIGELETYPVSLLVNSVKNNSPDCIKPINSRLDLLF